MAIKYLAGDRLIGTTAEREALITGVPTFEDTYASDTGWTKIGTWIEIASGVIKMNNGGTNADHRMHKSLGTTLSNSAWVYEFDFYMTAGRSAFATLLSSATGNPYSATQDEIGILHDSDGSMRTLYKDGAGTGYTVGTSVGTMSNSTQYYCTMTRTTTTNVKLEVFTNAARSTQFGSTQNQTIPSTVVDLAYIQTGTLDFGGSSSGGYWQVDNSKVYDGVTTAPSLAYPNLPNGAIFEDSTDGKHYMFDGTSAWNEIT